MKLLSISIAVFLFLCTASYGSQPDRDQKIGAAPSSKNAEDSLLFSALNFDFPGMEEVRKYYKQGDWGKAKIAYLEFRRGKS
ncbi:MAG: heparinase II/III family protein, partial [Bacteroidota bacterium]|nr:heparinase II/III family protein [Bacteroidota bacterium]